MLAALEMLRVLFAPRPGPAAQPQPVRRLGAAAGEPRRLPRRSRRPASRGSSRTAGATGSAGSSWSPRPVDEIAIRMTARVIDEVGRRRALPRRGRGPARAGRFNDELLGGRYAHGMLIDGNDPRGIDVGLLCDAGDRDRVGAQPRRRARSRRGDRAAAVQPGLSGLPAAPRRRRRPVRAAQPPQEPVVLQRQPGPAAHPAERAGARDLRPAARRRRRATSRSWATSTRARPTTSRRQHPTLEPLLGPGSPLVDAYHPAQGSTRRAAAGHASSPAALRNRLDYILLSPELAGAVTGGGVFRKGLWGDPDQQEPAPGWEIYPEITASATPRPTTPRSGSTSTCSHQAGWPLALTARP